MTHPTPGSAAVPPASCTSKPGNPPPRRRRSQGWPRTIWLFLIALQFLTLSAGAADKLEVDLVPSALRVRGEAPIPVEAKFRWNGTAILEGHLEVELHEANRVLGRYRSGDLALTTGEQNFHMLLPPCLDPYSDEQVEAQMKFVTRDQSIDLGYSVLFMPVMNERSFVLGWCNSHFGADQQASAQQALLFERMAPPAADSARRLLVTSVVRLAPEDLPGQPLAYTSFDVMVLTPEGFKEAREGQLRTLARWVKGGGSVCVFVADGLQAHHLAFLNELAGSTAIEPAFLVDANGNLLPGRNKISCLHSGDGRSVILTGTSAADPNSDATAWREAIAFLWKFRIQQVRTIKDSGHWEPVAESPGETHNLSPTQMRLFQQRGWRPNMNFAYGPSYSIQQSPLASELMQQLMPHTVRLIPFSALMATLGLFLLMIGPVDYFVLGMLRRRRYTWVLFPVTSVAFMILTVMMANYYLGLRDQRRSLTIVDLDKDGSPLRWNRYELVFAARDKQAVTDLKDALWAPLDSDVMPEVVSYNPGYPTPPVRRTTRRDSGPPWYDGALPVHFQASQALHQWQPQLNRIFSFEPPPVPLIPNWQGIEDAWPNLQSIRVQLAATKVSAEVYAITNSAAGSLDAGTEPILPREILQEMSYADSSGLLALVSQVSPNGGGNFEDLQGLDARAGDSALAIVTQNGDNIVVYRRFFYGK